MTMTLIRLGGALAAAALASCATVPDDAVRKELVPTGKLLHQHKLVI